MWNQLLFLVQVVFVMLCKNYLIFFRQIHHIEIKAFCGPAGILRQQIEQGNRGDIFISANPGNVLQLADSKKNLSKINDSL